MMSEIKSITPQELKDLLSQDPAPLILDVRDAWEFEICSFPNSIHIPLIDLHHERDQLPLDRPIVVVCHHGPRGLKAAFILMQNGFDDVVNLTGGIHAWAQQIDPTLERY
jgi:rhodanese-related sulfurtransferase